MQIVIGKNIHIFVNASNDLRRGGGLFCEIDMFVWKFRFNPQLSLFDSHEWASGFVQFDVLR